MTTFAERLETIARRFDEIEAELANPAGGFDQARYTALVKERASLEETVVAYKEFRTLQEAQRANAALLASETDPEMRELAEEEARELRARGEVLEARLQALMVPKDPDDEKDVFVEI